MHPVDEHGILQHHSALAGHGSDAEVQFTGSLAYLILQCYSHSPLIVNTQYAQTSLIQKGKGILCLLDNCSVLQPRCQELPPCPSESTSFRKA